MDWKKGINIEKPLNSPNRLNRKNFYLTRKEILEIVPEKIFFWDQQK